MSARETGDPRLRPFQVAMSGIFILTIAVFSGLIVASVARSVASMTPPRPQSVSKTLTVRECIDEGEALWRSLEDQRRGLSLKASARRADADWTVFRVSWLRRMREAEADCAVESRSRREIKAIYDRLDRVMDLYTTHAVQYAGEIGGSVDGLKEAIVAARRSPAAGRLP